MKEFGCFTVNTSQYKLAIWTQSSLISALSPHSRRVPQSAPADEERSRGGDPAPSSSVLRVLLSTHRPTQAMYINERRTCGQDGRSGLSASIHSSFRAERLAPCEVDRHGQRSNATESVRCPTELPRRATRSGSLRINACGDCAPCGYICICKARRGSRKPRPQRAH